MRDICSSSVTHGPVPLDADERNALKKSLPLWRETDDDRDAITRTFEFDNFVQAWGFMSRVALVAEKR